MPLAMNLRDLLWTNGQDEAVEVNQRALIDKVLARYAGEFSVFRELLQNSDDANSKSVEIHFESRAYLDGKEGKSGAEHSGPEVGQVPDLEKADVHRWTFKNDGTKFRPEDWQRLKRIAEGNPDEEKIGAFGVGFYSLFSITEEPFVTSGDTWMGFYWKDKKDQLFARKGILQDRTSGSPWTTFEMPLREPAPMPSAFEFTRFLSSSITFMRHLSSVSIFFDNKRLVRIAKDSRGGATGNPFAVPPGLKPRSPENTMRVRKIYSTPLHIKAEVMHCVYTDRTKKSEVVPSSTIHEVLKSGLFGLGGHSDASAAHQSVSQQSNRMEILESNVTLSVFSASVDISLSAKSEAELARSTKKKMPKTLSVEMIYAGRDVSRLKQSEGPRDETGETDGKADSDELNDIFQSLRADYTRTPSARVFIGHATAQTTGIGGHISARFIPTVEREAIDLMDANVAKWNKELLYVSGILARCAFNIEMARIRRQWDTGSSAESDGIDSTEAQKQLVSSFVHILRFFTFHPSTPSPLVSNEMEKAFFECAADNTLSFLSTVGVKPATDVRIPDPDFREFLKRVPVVHPNVLQGADVMVEKLCKQDILKGITFKDVLSELKARALNEAEIVMCLQWCIRKKDSADAENIRKILNTATLLLASSDGKKERLIPLATINTFIGKTNTFGFPLEGPIPSDTLPFSISKEFTVEALLQSLSWKELGVLGWLQHLVSSSCQSDVEHNICESPAWAEEVFDIVSKSWGLITSDHAAVIAILKDKACIPTQNGMNVPREAYFPSVDILPNLPIVTFAKNPTLHTGPLADILGQLGVRRHIELQAIFDRMIKTGDWTVIDFTKYLVRIQGTLTTEELDQLRTMAVFTKEGDEPKNQKKRYLATELYEPLDEFRGLGLPVMNWGTKNKWQASSDEAEFLFKIGLRSCPPLENLLNMAAGPNAAIRALALDYFLKNKDKYHDYDRSKFKNLAYIPAIKEDGSSKMGTPEQVFIDSDSAVFGYMIVHPTIKDQAVAKLSLQAKPPTELLVKLLEKSPPKDVEVARRWFETLFLRISDFQASTGQLSSLSHVNFIPQPIGDGKIRMVSPSDCYIGGPDMEGSFHSKLFLFVDFGPRANHFLTMCGAQLQPSVDAVAQQLAVDPKRFYDLAGGRENFLAELRTLAVNAGLVTPRVESQLKKAPVLLASKWTEAALTTNVNNQDFRDYEYELALPQNILIADHATTYLLFGNTIWVAPQEAILEDFYIRLGAQRLSKAVKEDYKPSSEIQSKQSSDIRDLVLERLPFFLYEHTYASLKLKYEWFNEENNFIVKTFEKIIVRRTLASNLTRAEEASAVCIQEHCESPDVAPVQLWLAANAQIDMYEVAASLCKVLFETPRANDVLLFMTILSTPDLRALERRGYNVARILRQQEAARLAAEAKARTSETERQQRAEKLHQDALAEPSSSLEPTLESSQALPPSRHARQARSALSSSDSKENHRRSRILSLRDRLVHRLDQRKSQSISLHALEN